MSILKNIYPVPILYHLENEVMDANCLVKYLLRAAEMAVSHVPAVCVHSNL